MFPRVIGLAQALSAVTACATAPVVPEPPAPAPAPRDLPVLFHNTTHTCARPESVLVEAGGRRWEVEPGGRAEIPLAEGERPVWLRRAQDDEPTPGTWTVPPPSPPYLGCADPRFLAPVPGWVAVRLTNLSHGCQTGLRGPVTWRAAGALLGTLAPGQEMTRYLPAAAHLLEAQGAAWPPQAIDLSRGAAEVATGCAPTPGRLAPLTVLHRPEACAGDGGDLVVGASSLRQTLAAGEAWTLYLPHGTYLLALGATERVRVVLGPDGQLLERSTCSAEASPAKTRVVAPAPVR